MHVQQTKLPGVLLIEPRVFSDPRGSFKETWQRDRYAAAGLPWEFVQDNISRSCVRTLRGLHFQIEQPQGKLVQVLCGEIFDVAVDLRRDSPEFGQWAGEYLSAENHRQLYIPPGFAHGFCVPGEVAEVFYKCTDFYAAEHERTLLWNDPTVGIDWPFDGEPLLSEKDQQGELLSQIECFESSL